MRLGSWNLSGSLICVSQSGSRYWKVSLSFQHSRSSLYPREAAGLKDSERLIKLLQYLHKVWRQSIGQLLLFFLIVIPNITEAIQV